MKNKFLLLIIGLFSYLSLQADRSSFGAGFAGGFAGSAVATLTAPRQREVMVVKQQPTVVNGGSYGVDYGYDDEVVELQNSIRRKNRQIRDLQDRVDELQHANARQAREIERLKRTLQGK